MKIKIIYLTTLVTFLLLYSCTEKAMEFDATGTFEASEIILSAENNGKIVSFIKGEGSDVKSGELLVQIDTVDINDQIDQVYAKMEAINLKTGNANAQVAILEEQKIASDSQLSALKTQLKVAEKESKRVQDLVQDQAATQKQLDDINGQIEILMANIKAASTQTQVLNAQINAARSNTALQNRAITSEKKPLLKQIAIMKRQIDKASVNSPIDGVILNKYAFENEFITMGRPLVKLANMKEMTLRAYVNGPQLSTIKLGQDVKVMVDDEDGYKEYPGKLTWISSEAEFTPKTIQTKDERANLVYAIKINVENDGFLKIGMYGEVDFNNSELADE